MYFYLDASVFVTTCLWYDLKLKDLSLMERCLKETLRLRPPIMAMMRMARTPQVSLHIIYISLSFLLLDKINIISNYNYLTQNFYWRSQTAAGYTIPVGHQICVSPTVNHRLRDTWVDRMEFSPDRYLNDNPAAGEKFAYIPFGAGELSIWGILIFFKLVLTTLLSSGRHRCIGENFAYVQIKTIWSTLLRMFEFDLVDGYFPTINYTTMIHTPYNPIIRYKRRKKWRHEGTSRELKNEVLTSWDLIWGKYRLTHLKKIFFVKAVLLHLSTQV